MTEHATSSHSAADELAEHLLAGSVRALARLVTLIEREDPVGIAALNTLYPRTGRAHVIGVTGPPGAGKSTLLDVLVARYREGARRVAVIAIDPTSPVSGGATLGDRYRMMRHHADPNVFIRSMANRGMAGGLAPAATSIVHLLDAAGFDPIFVETVGAGQSDISIMNLAQTTVVVQAPGTGDGVQSLKAGQLEIADILVVGKSDQPGADVLERDLKTMIGLAEMEPARDDIPRWQTPVVRVSTTALTGLAELVVAIDDHRRYLDSYGVGAVRWRQRAISEIALHLERELRRMSADATDARTPAVVETVLRRERSPWQAAHDLAHAIPDDPAMSGR